jgi:hypothetical protein
MTNLQNDIRALRTEEFDAVTGGIINGCIRFPIIIMQPPHEPKPYEDVFASKLPSWVRT